MRVTVNGEQREITSASVDALLSELEYEGTHFAIAVNLRRAAEKPLGGDGAEERRRDRDHHAAAGRVMHGRAHSPPVVPANAGTHNHRGRGDGRYLRQRPDDRTRRMGPCVRRDDEGCVHSPQTPLSSPGLTGRPSTPRPIGLNSGFPAYWIPAFGAIALGGDDECGCDDDRGWTLTPC